MVTLLYLHACGDSSTVCDGYPPQSESNHVLPFAVGENYLVTRAACASSHPPPRLQFAYDFAMPIGSGIHATRDGVVSEFRNEFVDGTGAGFGNYIYIEHSDNTVSRYAHLTENGILVGLGEAVVQGQLIGLSGNTGFSTGPHLHYDVADCSEDPNRCVTFPITFKNTRPHPEGLIVGEF
ncbi:MAG: M23 family metallopeptidase, partial [Pseudomonadota bacterium]